MSDTVFISYSSKDMQTVKKITRILNENGIGYWKAPEMIPAGSNYAREIPRAIERCQVFLLILSESSQQSIWVEKEIDCAVNYRKTIVPLKITEEPLSEMFRFYLNNVQAIDYTEEPQCAIAQLLERLAELTEATEEIKPYSRSFSAAATQMELPPESSMSVKKQDKPEVSRLERNNALKINQRPVVCQKCGGDLKEIFRGTFRCVDCGFEDYDSYRKVRNFLDQNGPKSATEISRATGVPRSAIEYFLKDQRLEIVNRLSDLYERT